MIIISKDQKESLALLRCFYIYNSLNKALGSAVQSVQCGNDTKKIYDLEKQKNKKTKKTKRQRQKREFNIVMSRLR